MKAHGSDGRLGRQGVRSRQHRHQLVFGQGQGVEALVGQDDKAQFHAPLQQPLNDCVVYGFLNVHLDQGVLLLKTRQELRQQTQRRGGSKRCDAQGAPGNAMLRIGFLLQCLFLLKDVIGAAQ